MSETTEIIAVTSTGLVGLGGLLLTYLGARSRQIFERQQERRVEARTVLEDAGVALTETVLACQDLDRRCVEALHGGGSLDQAAKAYEDEFDIALRRLQLAEVRVALRLTTKHPAYRAFRDGAAALNKTSYAFTVFITGEPYDRQTVGKLRDTAMEEQDRFLDAAAEYLEGD